VHRSAKVVAKWKFLPHSPCWNIDNDDTPVVFDEEGCAGERKREIDRPPVEGDGIPGGFHDLTRGNLVGTVSEGANGCAIVCA